MKMTRFNEPQFLAILRQAEGGVPVAELCREHGMSTASFYKWRAKYGCMDASMISKMKAMEDENRRLKRMYADLSMQADLLKKALGKKVDRPSIARQANASICRGSASRDGRQGSEASRGEYSVGVPSVWRQRDLL